MILLNLQGAIARFCAEVRNMLLAPLGSEVPGHHTNFKIIHFVIFFAFAYLFFLSLTGSGCCQCRFFF
tara:strand:- start:2148 stop:2351 length:204 start_codon:yes stop_codon:yes gene_type:complete